MADFGQNDEVITKSVPTSKSSWGSNDEVVTPSAPATSASAPIEGSGGAAFGMYSKPGMKPDDNISDAAKTARESFVRGLPGTGGFIAGAGAATTLAAPIVTPLTIANPIAGALTQLTVMMTGGMVGAGGVNYIADRLSALADPEGYAKWNKAKEQYPKSAALGSVVSGFAGSSYKTAPEVAGNLLSKPIVQRGVSGLLGGGMSVAEQATTGEGNVDLGQAAVQAVGGTALPGLNIAGRAADVLGRGVAGIAQRAFSKTPTKTTVNDLPEKPLEGATPEEKTTYIEKLKTIKAERDAKRVVEEQSQLDDTTKQIRTLKNERWKTELDLSEATSQDQEGILLDQMKQRLNSINDEINVLEDKLPVVTREEHKVALNKIKDKYVDLQIEEYEGSKKSEQINAELKILQDKETQLQKNIPAVEFKDTAIPTWEELHDHLWQAKNIGEAFDRVLAIDNLGSKGQRALMKVLNQSEYIRDTGLTLSNEYIPYTDKYGKEQKAAGIYTGGAEHRIDMGARGNMRVLLHEAMHSGTQRLVTEGTSPAAIRLKELHEEFKNKHELEYEAALEKFKQEKVQPTMGELRDFDKQYKKQYGLTDVHEFVSEAFTNVRFQKLLAGVKTTTPEGKLSNLWNDFKSAVREGLKIPEKERTALDEVFEQSAALIEESKGFKREGDTTTPLLPTNQSDVKETGSMQDVFDGKALKDSIYGFDLAAAQEFKRLGDLHTATIMQMGYRPRGEYPISAKNQEMLQEQARKILKQQETLIDTYKSNSLGQLVLETNKALKPKLVVDNSTNESAPQKNASKAPKLNEEQIDDAFEKGLITSGEAVKFYHSIGAFDKADKLILKRGGQDAVDVYRSMGEVDKANKLEAELVREQYLFKKLREEGISSLNDREVLEYQGIKTGASKNEILNEIKDLNKKIEKQEDRANELALKDPEIAPEALNIAMRMFERIKDLKSISNRLVEIGLNRDAVLQKQFGDKFKPTSAPSLVEKTSEPVAEEFKKLDPRSMPSEEAMLEHATDIYERYGEKDAIQFFDDYKKDLNERSIPVPNNNQQLDDGLHKMNTFTVKDESEHVIAYNKTAVGELGDRPSILNPIDQAVWDKKAVVLREKMDKERAQAFLDKENGKPILGRLGEILKGIWDENLALIRKIKAMGGDVGEEYTTGQSRIRMWSEKEKPGWKETIKKFFNNETPMGDKFAEQADAAIDRKVFQTDDGRVIELHRQPEDTKIQMPNGTYREVKKGTEIWQWRNGIKQMIGHSDNLLLKVGDKFETKRFSDKLSEGPEVGTTSERRTLTPELTIVDGKVPEIERHSPYRYLHDAEASARITNMSLRKMARELEFIENLKKSELFKQVAHGPDQDPKTVPNNYVAPKSLKRIPQLRGWVFDPKTAAIIEDFAKVWDNNMYMKLSNAIVKNMMLNPVPHMFNEVMHLWNARGFTGWVDPRQLGSFADTARVAWRDVGNQTQFYRDIMREGGSILGASPRNKGYFDTIIKDASKEIFGTPEMERSMLGLAKKLGTSVGDLYNGISDASQKAMWFTRDVMYVQLIREVMARQEKSGNKITIKEAIDVAERHMPNYRLPSEVVGSRIVSQVLRDPRISLFSRYHYGMVKSLVNTLKDIDPRNLKTPEGRAHFREGVDSMIAIGVALTVLYPLMDKMAEAVFGEGAEQRRAGPFHLLHAGLDVYSAKKDASALVWPVFTFNPVLLTLGQLGLNKKIFSGKNIYHPDDDFATIMGDVGMYTAGQIPQVPPIMSATADEGGESKLLARQLDIKVKTEAEKKREERVKKYQETSKKTRDKKREKETYRR